MIKVQNLSYQYRGSRTPVLQDINFQINDGEVVALVGQNGSGKSTLGRLIAGIYRPQRGSITIRSNHSDDPLRATPNCDADNSFPIVSSCAARQAKPDPETPYNSAQTKGGVQDTSRVFRNSTQSDQSDYQASSKGNRFKRHAKRNRHRADIRTAISAAKVAIVFQNPENQLIFNKVNDEIGFVLRDLSRVEREERIVQSLELVGMASYRDRDLQDLSLGQKQRIVLAEALAQQPRYLILDEPTTMIDGQGKEAIYQIIRNLRKTGCTILCITNLADEILLADRTLILSSGQIVAEIPKSELIQKAHALTEYGIRLPTLLNLLQELQKYDINLQPADWTIAEIARCLHNLRKERHEHV